jgi:3-oxoacyl-[acyl-carrier protein] reductase
MKQTEPRLGKKVALITGASRGLGEAMALRFAEEGAAVAVNYLKNADRAEEIRQAIVAAGGKAICVQADVAEPAQVNHMVQTVLQELGPIDILVNNAGVAKFSPILKTSLADLDFMVGVNLKGTLLCVQAVARCMMEKKYGRILNFCSTAGLGTAFAGTSAYAATKGALVVLTKRMAMELGAYNITVNAIAPGLIRTDTALNIGTQSEAEVRQKVADTSRKAMLGRIGEPQDIANAALFLVSDEASFITAQTLSVDGGRMDFLTSSA